jgi:serine/threonine protein kinase
MGNGAGLEHSAALLNASLQDTNNKVAKAAPLRIFKGARRSQSRRYSFGRWGVGKKRTQKACLKEGIARKGIELACNFAELYKLGRTVTEVSKPGTRVRYAERASDGLPVVVKLLLKGTDGHGSFASAKDEAEWRTAMERALALPEHPGIGAILSVLEDESAYYVVMERVKGKDLFEALCEERLSVADTQEVVKQLLGAISTLHTEGLIHKDLKLENVIFHRDCVSNAIQVKLIDFDTLCAWSPSTSPAEDVLGSDQYIAPEAYAGRYSFASDMFAVGVIAYRLLTGAFPFDQALFDDEPGENVVGHPKMDAICSKISSASICWKHHVFVTNAAAQHWCKRALSITHQVRPTARESLDDPWLAQAQTKADVLEPGAPIQNMRPCTGSIGLETETQQSATPSSISQSSCEALGQGPASATSGSFDVVLENIELDKGMVGQGVQQHPQQQDIVQQFFHSGEYEARLSQSAPKLTKAFDFPLPGCILDA